MVVVSRCARESGNVAGYFLPLSIILVPRFTFCGSQSHICFAATAEGATMLRQKSLQGTFSNNYGEETVNG